MAKLICDTCRRPIKATAAMVVVNVADEPTQRWHTRCFVTAPEQREGAKP
jgi:hypothetical protein